MAEIITYKPGAYCQIKLASGERVLISCAQTGIKQDNKVGSWRLATHEDHCQLANL